MDVSSNSTMQECLDMQMKGATHYFIIEEGGGDKNVNDADARYCIG